MRRNELHKILIVFVFASLILAMPLASAFKESGNGYNITGAIGRTGDTVSAGGYNLTVILLESPVVRETSPSYNTSLGWFYLVVEEDTAPSNITNCTTINMSGYYILENDISDSGETTCINITASNVIFDGQGHTIDGTDAANTYGVYVYNSPALTNVTIRNLTVTDWYVGIYLKSTENSTITDNTATSNSKQGIYLTASSNNNTIINNDASGNQWGIYLISSTGNTLINNTANSNYASGGVNAFGIVLYSSTNNVLINNTANSNTVSGAGGGYGIYLGYLSSSDNNTLTGNTAEDNDVGGIYLLNSANNTLTDNTAKENDGYDFFFNLNSKAQCSNVVENNTGSGDRPVKYFNSPVNLTGEVLSALILCNADNSNITNVTIEGSSTKDNNMLQARMTDYSNFTNINSSDNRWGITLAYSNNNTIADNTLSGNTYGLEIAASTGNDITNNIANSNSRGVYIQASSTNNTIANNAFLSCTYGIQVSLSSYNNILNNTIAGSSQYGIWLYSSSNNTIYNNLMNNTKHTYFTGTTYGNDWNITKQAGTNIVGGPYIGGNFWAYPNGTGFSEMCTDVDGDGICDSNYTLASGNVDYLPLTFTVAPETNFNISLLQGWNLISLPLTPENTSLDAVLASIEGNYTVVYRWTDCLWKKSTAVRNPLAEMTVEYGYWIGMTAPDTLELIGTVPTSTTINVTTACWNLVGYPSPTTRNLTDVLSPINYTVVYAYINGVWKKSTAVRNPLTEMSPGYGYWIHANEDGSYEV